MVAATRPHSTGNRLLDRLPADEYEALLAHLEPITLSQNEVIYEQKGPARHVYFPQRGLFRQ